MADFHAGQGQSDTGQALAPEEKTRKHLFILNPRSFRYLGGTEPISGDIRRYFRTSGYREEDCSIHVSRYPRDAIGVIRKYMDGIPGHVTVRVYAVGGNGILFDCLNGLVGIPNTELAALPYGNTNDFVRAFGEDKVELFRDIAMQATSPTIPTDIINYGSNHAMNFCTIGMESAAIMQAMKLSRTFALAIRLRRGLIPSTFILGALLGIFDKKVRLQHYNINIDGQDFSGRYASINIGNGPCYGGDKCAVSSAMPDDGILDAVLFHSAGVLRTLARIPVYVTGRSRRRPDGFTHIKGRKITVGSAKPLLVNLDGEVFFDTRVTLEIVPAAVNFVAVNGLRYVSREPPRPKAGAPDRKGRQDGQKPGL